MINFNCGAAYLEADFATTIQEFALNTHHVRVVARMARTQSRDESGWATKYLLRDVIRQQNGRQGVVQIDRLLRKVHDSLVNIEMTG